MEACRTGGRALGKGMHDQFRLDEKVVWVTGSSRGLGRGIAMEMATAGARVVVNCRHNVEAGEAVVQSIHERGGQAVLVAGDVTDESAIDRMVGEIESSLGPVDALVVNATPDQPMKPIESYTIEEYEAMLQAFVRSPFLLTKRLVPSMKTRESGRIINITSEVFHLGMPEFSAYVAAKGGQIGWSRSMANELAPWGITVNTVAPGWIPVERHEEIPEADKEGYLKTIPLGRWGTPADVAGAVRFFASDAGSFLTGQTLVVNGGKTPW